MFFIITAALLEPDEMIKFDIMYKKYNKLALKIAIDMLNDKMSAEDAVAETYMRLVKYIDAIGDPYSTNSKYYLVKIVENVCRDQYRKQKGTMIVDVHGGDGEETEETNDITEGTFTEDFSAMEKDDIVKAIETLPDIYRDVLVLKYFNELNDNEIADALGIAAASVRKRLERAKKMLKSRLIKVGIIDENEEFK